MNVINRVDTGAFTGQYSNGQSGWCAKSGDWFPLTGALTSENAITFTVKWKNSSTDCNSTAVWTGNKKDKLIKTKWVLTSSTRDPVTGSDTFTRDCQCRRCPEPEVKSKTNN
ncbi:avidin/streptavidin family protein [Shewanella surugensis]|uniref:Avidin/streptavidin family protein n=2 Tax=Shewanella surugensis TaxID=212020 RepID=A0ABT0LH62_9GAMM|nr:avidin/streptavidin family protein [Shewanella surugensis]